MSTSLRGHVRSPQGTGIFIELTETQAQCVAEAIGRRQQSASHHSPLGREQRLIVSAAATSRPQTAKSAGPLLRILTILAAFSPEQARGVTEVSRTLGYSKTTVHRCVRELAQNGLLIQDESRRYRLRSARSL